MVGKPEHGEFHEVTVMRLKAVYDLPLIVLEQNLLFNCCRDKLVS
jgi:hypothetical protein